MNDHDYGQIWPCTAGKARHGCTDRKAVFVMTIHTARQDMYETSNKWLPWTLARTRPIDFVKMIERIAFSIFYYIIKVFVHQLICA